MQGMLTLSSTFGEMPMGGHISTRLHHFRRNASSKDASGLCMATRKSVVDKERCAQGRLRRGRGGMDGGKFMGSLMWAILARDKLSRDCIRGVLRLIPCRPQFCGVFAYSRRLNSNKQKTTW